MLAVLILPLACFAPQVQAPFTEEALTRGIDYDIEQTDSFGSGMAFADLDNDGDPDLVATGRVFYVGQLTTIGLWENDGSGFFASRSLGSGIPPLPYACAVTAADYDGDGDLDLHIGCWLTPDRLLRNDGGFQFTDVAALPEMDGMNDIGAAQGSGWGDFDGDTWLDLYVANRTGTNRPDPPYPPTTEENRLYRNLAGAGFEEMAVAMGVNGGNDRSFQGSFFDYDRDGDADLYLSNDKGFSTGCLFRNRMWENTGGAFLDISASSGTDGCIDAMCIAFGDLDHNGFLDIYVSNLPVGNYLYMNNGDGTFSDDTLLYDVGSYRVGWGSIFWDYDNDGWLDIYVSQHNDPNRLFTFDGVPPARDMAPELGVDDPGETFTCATADVDDDGDLDLVVANRSGRLNLYINHEGSQRNWAKLRVVGEGANLFGVGTGADVRTGTTWRYREVIAGSAFKAQDDLTLHFGLDTAAVMDEIVVAWPGGATRSLQDYPANRTWTLYPPSRLGDADGDGVVALPDFFAFQDAFGGPVAPGAEMLDLNGDALVDAGDIPGFLALWPGPLLDCNGNGSADLADILLGTSSDGNRNGIPEECELVLASPAPGTAGGANTLQVANATPGVRVYFAYSLAAGSRGLPGCPGVLINLQDPEILGSRVANAMGDAGISINVPARAGGRSIYFQAAQRGACRVSNLVEHAFP